MVILHFQVETKGNVEEGNELLVYDEFHPFLYKQHENRRYIEFESFNQVRKIDMLSGYYVK